MTDLQENPRRADRIATDKRPFIDSHQANSVRSRQYSRVVAEVERLVQALHLAGGLEKPVPRAIPDRYVVQAGFVALSVAWIRGAMDTVSDGTLMAIVWRGTIAPRRAPEIERVQVAPARTATSVWEDLVSVAAENEASWRWLPNNAGPEGFTSEGLAERMVGQLHAAHRAVAA